MKLAKKLKQLLGLAPREAIKSKEFYSEYTADENGGFVVRVYSRKTGLQRIEKGTAKTRASACTKAAKMAADIIHELDRG